MLQRNKHLNKKLIRYHYWYKSKNKLVLNKSFKKNFLVNYKSRISLSIQNRYTNSFHRFYFSQNKLQCFLHYSFSVPNKKVNVSRFFLTKGLERLMFSGYQK